MASRRYWPTLVAILRTVCTYIARYRVQIVNALGEGSADALDGIVMACDVFIALCPDNTGD